jgi:hypothetical protein
VKRSIAVTGLTIATLVLSSSVVGAINMKAAGEQYVKDVASANVALKTFNAEIDAWSNSTADAEGERQAASVLAALQATQKNLLSQSWPRYVRSGVRFICEEDISSLEEDLREIDSNSSLGNGAFQLTFREDSKTLDSHAFYLRKDLGLPGSGAL